MGLYQKTTHAGKFVLLQRKHDNFELLVYDVGNREGVGLI
jgi:hypothetical protein